LLKDEELVLRSDVQQAETVVTASRYDDRLGLVYLDVVIDKYQTGVDLLSTTYGSPTDAVSD